MSALVLRWAGPMRPRDALAAVIAPVTPIDQEEIDALVAQIAALLLRLETLEGGSLRFTEPNNSGLIVLLTEDF